MKRDLGLGKDRIGATDEKNYQYANKLAEMINCKTVFSNDGVYTNCDHKNI